MILLLGIMTAISMAVRWIPFLFSKWLKESKLLEKLSATLPLCISILMVAHLLHEVPFQHYPFAMPELAGIAAVIGVHIWLRQLLLSMTVGICVHQLLLYLL